MGGCESGEVSAVKNGAAVLNSFFLFQAKDGIRDLIVTGVQTCALPIFEHYAGKRALPQLVDEQDFLVRLIVDELRQGALAGVMLDAIAAAARLPQKDVRRAAMYSRSVERRVGIE